MIRFTLLDSGLPLDFPDGTTLQLERRTNLLDASWRGSYSYSTRLDLSPQVRQALGWVDELDVLSDLQRGWMGLLEVEGSEWGLAYLKLRSHTSTQLSVNLQLGLGALLETLKAKKLRAFHLGGARQVPAAVPLQQGGQTYYVPGLIWHANNTVRDFAAHDYVFAPILNEALYGEPPAVDPADPNSYQPGQQVVNPWFFYTEQYPFLGRAPGGTFLDQATVSSSIGLPQLVNRQLPMCPFPKLTYLVPQLLREAGAPVVGLELDEELQQLVLLSNAYLPVDLLGYSSAVRLSDVLPDCTALELLTAVCGTLGLFPTESAGGVRLRHVRDVLASPRYTDLTDRAQDVLAERTIEETAGVTLTYRLESGDKAAASYFTVPAAAPAPAVATRTALPGVFSYVAGDPLPAPEVRLVEDEGAYYHGQAVLNYVQLIGAWTWTKLAQYLPPVALGGGGEEQPQACTATAVGWLDFLPSTTYTERALVPALWTPYAVPNEPFSVSASVRLAFYRGLQPYQISPNHPFASAHPTYPMLTPFRHNAVGSAVGNQSLQLDGEAGTVMRYLGQLWRLRLAGVRLKRRFRLSAQEIADLEVDEKILVDGQFYLVLSMSVEVPVRDLVTLELLPIDRVLAGN